MKFKKQDFKNCILHPFMESDDFNKKVIDMGMDQKFPPDYRHLISEVCLYTALFYDKNSPYNTVGEYRKRKALCAEEAGLKVRDMQFTTECQEILNCVPEWYRKLVFTYLKNQGARRWTKIVALNQHYHNMLEILMKPDDKGGQMKTKTDIAQKVDAIDQQIEESTRQFMNHEQSDNLEQHVFMIASLEAEEMPALSPEYYAHLNHEED